MDDEKVIKEVDGVAISVTPEGKFHAVIDGKHVRLASLRDLEKRIRGSVDAAPALYVYEIRDVSRPKTITVTEVTGDGRVRYRYSKEEGLRLSGYGDHIYVYDADAKADLWVLAEAANEAIDAYRERVRTLRVMTAAALAEYRAKQPAVALFASVEKDKAATGEEVLH